MFADDALSQDGFLGGQLQILQPRSGYRAATDPVLLAASVPARAGQSVLELGCGAGVALLCLGHRVPGLMLAGLELQPAYGDLARRNAVLNGQQVEVVAGDVAAMPATLRARRFDHVLLNPPYYSAGEGTPASDPGRETALREAVPLAVWLRAGLARTRPGGTLTLIAGADRLPDALAALTGTLTVQPLAARIGRPATRVIVQAKKNGRAPLRLLFPLILHESAHHRQDGEDLSTIARAVLRDGAPLSLGA